MTIEERLRALRVAAREFSLELLVAVRRAEEVCPRVLTDAADASQDCRARMRAAFNAAAQAVNASRAYESLLWRHRDIAEPLKLLTATTATKWAEFVYDTLARWASADAQLTRGDA